MWNDYGTINKIVSLYNLIFFSNFNFLQIQLFKFHLDIPNDFII